MGFFGGTTIHQRSRDPGRTHRLWERFHSSEIHETLTDDPQEMGLVEAWVRSKTLGVDPRRQTLPILSGEERQRLLRRNRLLLSNATPLLDWSGQFLSGIPGILVLTDGEATVLYVGGHQDVRERAEEERNLVEGALFPESVAGTNGIGTSLFLQQPVQVCSAEHFLEALQGWTCAAAPIRDPFSDGILGVIDLSFPSDPDTAALSIADSLASRITGEIRVHVASERLQLINRHGALCARYPSDEVLAYDRLGRLVRSSHGPVSGEREPPSAGSAPEDSVETLFGPGGEDPIGTLVVRRGAALR